MPAFLLLPAITAALAPALPAWLAHPHHPIEFGSIPIDAARAFADAGLPHRSCLEGSGPAAASDDAIVCAAARSVEGAAQSRMRATPAPGASPFELPAIGIAALPGLGVIGGGGTAIAVIGRITLGRGGTMHVGLDSIPDQRLAGFREDQRRDAIDAGRDVPRPRSS